MWGRGERGIIAIASASRATAPPNAAEVVIPPVRTTSAAGPAPAGAPRSSPCWGRGGVGGGLSPENLRDVQCRKRKTPFQNGGCGVASWRASRQKPFLPEGERYKVRILIRMRLEAPPIFPISWSACAGLN